MSRPSGEGSLAPVGSAPPPAPVQKNSGGSMLGGLGATIAQDMALATVDSVMGPRTIQHETAVSESPASAPAPAMNSMVVSDLCYAENQALQDCLNKYGNDFSKCEYYFDKLAECRSSSYDHMMS